ncbi:MAG: UDP-glucose 6-dehydrogenase [Verrucomicrobiales bacterium]|nr:UDP-glucose 6-dehydrogenase [Verrucomicrobiales bacterium]
MKVAIHGCGYVGLVTGACLADVGNTVTAVDVDAERVTRLNAGETPIYEPGLEALLRANLDAGRLRFTIDPEEAVAAAETQFICVGTPPREDGAADLKYVIKVADVIGRHMEDYRLVVTKSTVPVGTADAVAGAMKKALDGRQVAYDVASNPEFLKEGDAVNDFMKPDRIVVGTNSTRAEGILRELYAPFNRNHDRVLVMDVRSAELTKYAANAMLATRISFMNEMAGIAERVGANIENVRQGIGSDPRIGWSFIYPGCGYGGSCFPKDVRAVEQTARQEGLEPQILRAVDEVNTRQKGVLFEKIATHFGDDLKGRTIAVWGLSFKPNTDDMREAPSRVLIDSLLKAGALVRAHDPEAIRVAEGIFDGEKNVTLLEDPMEAAKGADALVIVTEWKAYRSPDWVRLRKCLNEPVVVDGRNLFEPETVREAGLVYYSIGRAPVRP